jgi:DNA processing protein
MNTATAILHLSLIGGVGPATITTILERITGDISSTIYYFTISDWMRVCGFTQDLAQRIVSGLTHTQLLERELSLLDIHAIQWVAITDDAYPTLLRTTYSPPAILYWQGLSPIYSQPIAMVGARDATSYGARAAQLLVPELVNAGCTVISGGARGIDTICHQITIDTGGATVAVLGSGLLNPYPSSNARLFKEIVATGGTVVSSFPLGCAGLPGNFPARNRIIAGLSRGCVVVQAARKSGALITAEYALDYGRDVFAIPGCIDDESMVGCNLLIAQGAKLVIDAADILNEYNWHEQAHVQQTFFKPIMHRHERRTYPVDSIEARLLAACSRSVSVDDIADALAMNIFGAQSLLCDMQLEGLVEQDFAGLWRAK